MPLYNQIVNSLFLSVTSRTAGFNLINTGLLSNATVFFIVMLMFIGGCSGSTAGGIKVNTFMVLASMVKNKIRGALTTSIFKRKIPSLIVDKALAISGAAFVTVCLATLFLQITEQSGVAQTVGDRHFLDLMFEAVSAFGTVGLSTGVTSQLSVLGKLVIIFLMFIGRVGPITLGVAILVRRRKQLDCEYVEEEALVG